MNYAFKYILTGNILISVFGSVSIHVGIEYEVYNYEILSSVYFLSQILS
jgi:hypothetical protein